MVEVLSGLGLVGAMGMVPGKDLCLLGGCGEFPPASGRGGRSSRGGGWGGEGRADGLLLLLGPSLLAGSKALDVAQTDAPVGARWRLSLLG
jgi:hypothetical protein